MSPGCGSSNGREATVVSHQWDVLELIPLGLAGTVPYGVLWKAGFFRVSFSKELPQGTVARGSFPHLFATDTSSNLESAGS